MPNGPIANFDQAIPNFVSKHVRKYYWRTSSATQGPQMQPCVLEGFAAVVMVDVSGYSKLSSTLAERGPIGAEILGKTMKDYLDKIIHIILLHGGDIVKFVGDAVIFYWKIPGTVDTSGSEQDLARGEIVLKACNCCLDLLTQLGTYNIDIPDCSTKELRIHLGIGAGKIYDIHVGGSPGRWEHFVAGDAVSQLSQVLDLAKAGELAVSHQALKWFSCVMDIDTVNIGDYDKRCILLSGLERARRKVPPPTPTEHDELDLWEIQTGTLNIELYKTFINHSAIFKLQADINQSKLFRLESSLADLMSLYELRQVSTLFIRVGSLSKWEGAEFIEEAQQAISVVQTALQKYEGSLRQFNVDDKGASILAFFGLPPLAHENDAIYCIKAGLEVKDKFRDIFDHFSIGITTGVVSIGGVGNSIRTEYAVMGDSINMAARLMMHHEAQESILCDEKSYNLCDRDFVFEKLGQTKVKGKSKPISIFRPKAVSTEDSQARRANIETNSSGTLVMFGRHNEREAIINALESQTRADTSKILTFQADGGQGLSTLVKFTQIEAIRHGCCPW
ncbi:nucleotide cyclase [Cladochytrium replicatum]|nr:nucleotide cyclase [Cladochytrium replicatum]